MIETGSTIGGWEDEPWVFKVTRRIQVPYEPSDYPHPDLTIDIDEAANFYSMSTKE